MKRATRLAISLACGCASLVACGDTEGPELVGPIVELPDENPAASLDPAIRPAPTGTPESTALPTRAATAEPTAIPQATLVPVPSPVPVFRYSRPPAPNGRTAPDVATTPAELAQQIETAEKGLANAFASEEELGEFGHLQQVAYRKLAREDGWDESVQGLLPAELRDLADTQVRARRALRGLHSGFESPDFIPAWEIIAPESADALLGYYREAEELTGIEWEYLAAINLLETGFGRIRGLSSAGAQGPMQFIPTTWDLVGDGDVNNPRDAILAAGRYLQQRGGPADMPAALFGYNNSDEYVASVTTYAALLRAQPDVFRGLYHWEIYFSTEDGDVWLPVGTRTEQIDLDEFLILAPWSRPDLGLDASG